MRAVIQRVSRASVSIDQKVTGNIGLGLLILLGIEDEDNEGDIEWLSGKIVRMRIFPDGEGTMNRSVLDVGGSIMLISQFTLHASTRKGNRPSYIRAAKPDIAIPLYQAFICHLENDLGKKVITGEFGEKMDISLVNTGPVTIIIDTRTRD